MVQSQRFSLSLSYGLSEERDRKMLLVKGVIVFLECQAKCRVSKGRYCDFCVKKKKREGGGGGGGGGEAFSRSVELCFLGLSKCCEYLSRYTCPVRQQ